MSYLTTGRTETALLASLLVGCTAGRSAPAIVAAPATDSILAFQTLAVAAASDRRADAIEVFSVRGSAGGTYALRLSFPTGSLDEDWPAAEVARATARWSFRIAPASACRDAADWPYARSPGCRTNDETCVGADLPRWTSAAHDCFSFGDASFPVALARVHGVAIPVGLPWLSRRGLDWRVEIGEANSDERPLVFVDAVPEDPQRTPRVRILQGPTDVDLEHARIVTRSVARDAFARFYEASGLTRDDADGAARLVLPDDSDPRDSLGHTATLHATSVLLLVPVTGDELASVSDVEIDASSLHLVRAGVVRWTDGMADQGHGGQPTRSSPTYSAPSPRSSVEAYGFESLATTVEQFARDCALESGHPVAGRVVVDSIPVEVDESLCSPEWNADTDGDGVDDCDEDACSGLRLDIVESTVDDEAFLECLGHTGPWNWMEIPSSPVRVFLHFPQR